MTALFRRSFFSDSEDLPGRPISAPPKLQYNNLFSYHVNSTQADDSFYSNTGSLDLDQLKQQPFKKDQTPSTRSRSNSSLINDMIQDLISNDDFPEPSDVNFNFFDSEISSFTFFYESAYSSIYEMAKDQMGCRMLQHRLESGDLVSKNSIFTEVLPFFSELMIDSFGNYLCQKLMEVCDQAQIKSVVSLLCPYLVTISLDTHGTRAVQKLIEVTQPHAEMAQIVASSLSANTVMLINDINGNHVIQRCLHTMPPELNQFIYNAASAFVIEISTHRHGCCVIQRCLDAASQQQKADLIKKITENAVVLVQDAFGNYVVQYVLDLEIKGVNEDLANVFLANIGMLAKQKFSSNVLEKCLMQNEVQVQQKLIEVIIVNAKEFLFDQYANYGKFYAVVQRALSLAPRGLFLQTVQAIKPYLDDLRHYPFGKKVYSNLTRKYPELSRAHAWGSM